MASPDPRFTAAIPTATVQSAVNTTLALKIVVGRFGQMTQRISEIISRKTFRLPLRLITTGLPWPHDGCPAHPVVGGAGGLGGRGGVRALAGSGSIPRVSRSATRVASARRFFSTILEVLLHRRSNRSKHGGRVRRLQSTQIRIRQPKRWAPSTVLEPAIEHTRPGAEQRARTTVALQASAQNGTSGALECGKQARRQAMRATPRTGVWSHPSQRSQASRLGRRCHPGRSLSNCFDDLAVDDPEVNATEYHIGRDRTTAPVLCDDSCDLTGIRRQTLCLSKGLPDQRRIRLRSSRAKRQLTSERGCQCLGAGC